MTTRVPRRPEDWLGDAETEQLTAWLDEMRAKNRHEHSIKERSADTDAQSCARVRLEREHSETRNRDGPRR